MKFSHAAKAGRGSSVPKDKGACHVWRWLRVLAVENSSLFSPA
jgi:hypothetical protein